MCSDWKKWIDEVRRAEWEELRAEGRRDFIVYERLLPGVALGLLLAAVSLFKSTRTGKAFAIEAIITVVVAVGVSLTVNWIVGVRQWTRREKGRRSRR